MRENFSIRKAAETDVKKITLLENAIFSDPWSENLLRDSLQHPTTLFLVAEEEGEILGYCVVQMIADEANLNNIAVKETARGRGIARAMMEEAFGWAKNNSCALITLEVRVSNEKARRLYERFGFGLVGMRRKYYESPVENAAIYTLFLDEEEK